MKRPKTLRIGPFDIDIGLLPTEDEAANFGNYENEKQKIGLRKEYSNARQEAEVLLHETIHAVWDIYQLRDVDKEERAVASISIGLAQVMRDNKEFMDYLRQALK